MRSLYIRAIFLSLLLIMGTSAFTAPRSHAFEAPHTGSQLRATPTTPLTTSQLTEVTSTDHHTACKRGCEEKYPSCLAAKKAKGWSDDRAEKICGLAVRSCKGGCDRR
jgi:hypothetical protein